MSKSLALIALTVIAIPVLAEEAAVAPEDSNPFFTEWTTPFGAPPFDEITDADFLPAIEEGIARQKAEMKAILGNDEPATFANTVEALELSGDFLDRVNSVFFNMLSAETNDELQEVSREVAPKLSALRDDIRLDPALFERVKVVWEARESLELDPEQLRLVEETYKGFVRGGAGLEREKGERLREINSRLATLGIEFGENLRADTNSFKLVIDNEADLSGLPDGVVAGAAEAAKAAGLEGKWLFTLQAPSIWPFLSYADNRDLRREILTAYLSRCNHGDEHDNNAILTEIAALRAEKAQLLGYPTWAHFVLEERMAKDPDGVYGLLDRLWKPSLARAQAEATALQAMIDEEGGEFQLEPWDWRYYSEKVKAARYDLDEDALRPYFALDNVLAGAFWVASQLYGIAFEERTDLPLYNPEVRTFEVKDKAGSHLAVYYVDYFPRPGKRVGAWSSRFRSQRFKDGKDVRPLVTNVGNFSRPTGEQPALLRIEEVETLFHELGHGLHSILSQIHYSGLARTPRDFVELPSQVMENWVLEPEVLKVYARHWQTDEVIPDELIAKIQEARLFNIGFTSVEYLAASYLDMSWHTLAESQQPDPAAFEKKALDAIGLIPEIPVRYRSPYFSHIFGGSGGYSAGYYSYMWSEVLDADVFSAFQEKGLFDPATALAFRTEILERGGTEEAMTLYVNFRGREPSVDPLLERRGLK